MNIVSSIEYVRSPFAPDKRRGHWASLTDYISAAISVGFQLDMSSSYWLYVVENGVLDIIPYMLCLGVYAVPLVLLHSYLGQFSSSGYISALRISPLFKGIGYVGMTINFCILMFLSSHVTTPLFFFLNSFWPTLPWSCEGMLEWNQFDNHLCNETLTDALKELANATSSDKKSDFESMVMVRVPSSMYYWHQFNNNETFDEEYVNPKSFRTPWKLIICHVIVWGLVVSVFRVLRSTEKLGRLLTVLVRTTVALMLICLVRFIFLPSIQWSEMVAFKFDWRLLATLLDSPLVALRIFGTGWGAMMSVASYNKFTTDINRSAWLICGVQMLITVCFALINIFIEGHLQGLTNLDGTDALLEQAWSFVLSSGSALANLRYPNLWCLLYYGMGILSAFAVLIIHVHSFFTALFDEFLYLRERKDMVIFGLLGLWAFLSLHEFTSIGDLYNIYLSIDNQVVQHSLHLLVFMVLMWSYGHARLRRDLEFMIGYRFPDWSVYVVRFVTPIFLVMTMGSLLSHATFLIFDDLVDWVALLCLTLPWLVFPYIIWYLMRQATGPLLQRWKKICLPTDWYPVDHEDRRRYEDAFPNDTVDGTQQLDEVLDTAEHP